MLEPDVFRLEAQGVELTADTFSFDSPEDREPDPLAVVEYTGNEEHDGTTEAVAIKNAFAERAKKEAKRFEKATDSEYWICLCFQTRAQKEEFLRNAGLSKLGDRIIDGQVAAEILGVEITRDKEGFGNININKSWADLT